MYCEKCDEYLPDDSEFCPYCGSPATDKKEEIIPENICSSCKKEIPDDSEFCPFCGEKVVLATNVDVSKKAKPEERKVPEPVVYIGPNGIKEKTSIKDSTKSVFQNIRNKSFGRKEIIAIVVSAILLLAIIITVVAVVISSTNKKKAEMTNTTNYSSYRYTDSYTQTEERKTQSFEDWYRTRTYEEDYDYNDDSDYDYYEEDYTSDYYTKPVSFSTLTYSGTGKASVKRINLPKGDYYIICTYNGEHNFFAYFHESPSDSYGSMIANFVGSGSSIYGISGEASNGYIDVDSSGSWTIKIEKCAPGNKSLPLKFNGNGTSGIKNINLPNGEYYITCKYTGEHNFFAYFHESSSDSYGSMIANFVGSGEETYAFSGSAKNGYINIDSSGKWTVEIERV